ncbi:MAG: aldehyde dehydrogenase (NADP(+)) [Candidatus Acidiferrales bacterium]
MALHGNNFIGTQLSSAGPKKFFAFDPREGKPLDTPFREATEEEINRSLELAAKAFPVFRESAPPVIAAFLERIAGEIEQLGDQLIDQAASESGLGRERLTGERGRTVNQLRFFANLVKDESFVDARIDPALPQRKPLPRPDLRRILIPIGPVVIFGASNFPLAFSVAGGDTASAFAARCPVIVKGHPAHPGTSELMAGAVSRAVQASGLPEGTFSLVNAVDPAMSLALVRHPLAKAVAFTGSLRAGRAIFDAATQRPDPIPAYLEMGSTNPVFLLPSAIQERTDALVRGLTASVNLGVGQFCTCPGLIFSLNDNAFAQFREKLAEAFRQSAPATMVHPSVLKGYEGATSRVGAVSGVRETRARKIADPRKTEATPILFETDSATWLANEALADEVFGPGTILVRGESEDELMRMAESLPGSLTATVHGTPDDLRKHRKLIALLETKCGRLIFNGYPTGLEVSHAIHHGGPYPATGDPKFTSVGAAAISRFLRPICYQDFPDEALPPELQRDNPRQIWRTVDGQLTRDSA